MTLIAYSGWDFARIGSFSIAYTQGAPFTATVTTGSYNHIDLQSVMGSGSYDDFATQLKTAMDTAGGGTWTVTWSTTTLTYTISNASAFTIDAGTNTVAKNVLGFNSLPTASATSRQSQIRPYYVLAAQQGALAYTTFSTVPLKSRVTDDYEVAGVTSTRIADDGTAYSLSRSTGHKQHDFSVRMEAKDIVYTREALTSFPFTWQRLFEHARGTEPITVVESETTVHKLLGDGASFAPEREMAEYDELWAIPFRTLMVGR